MAGAMAGHGRWIPIAGSTTSRTVGELASGHIHTIDGTKYYSVTIMPITYKK